MKMRKTMAAVAALVLSGAFASSALADRWGFSFGYGGGYYAPRYYAPVSYYRPAAYYAPVYRPAYCAPVAYSSFYSPYRAACYSYAPRVVYGGAYCGPRYYYGGYCGPRYYRSCGARAYYRY